MRLPAPLGTLRAHEVRAGARGPRGVGGRPVLNDGLALQLDSCCHPLNARKAPTLPGRRLLRTGVRDASAVWRAANMPKLPDLPAVRQEARSQGAGVPCTPVSRALSGAAPPFSALSRERSEPLSLELSETPCPRCGSLDVDEMTGAVNRWKRWRCRSCGLVWAPPRPSPSQVSSCLAGPERLSTRQTTGCCHRPAAGDMP